MLQMSHNKMIAQVGDPLAIRFEILDTDTPYDMFVRELVATDGAESAEVLLVDTVLHCTVLYCTVL